MGPRLSGAWMLGASWLVRPVAVVTFLFFLNAFIQSGFIHVSEVLVGLGWLALCWWLSGRYPVPQVLVLVFLGCVAWGLFIESRPVSDWLYFHRHAEDLSQGQLYALFESKSFTTVLYGSMFHLLLGSGWVTNYIASALVWTAGSAFVYRAVLSVTGDERLARFVCFALALCPTFLVFSPVLGSKGVFYLMSAVCAWLVSKHLHDGKRTPWLYPALGLAAGLLCLTRPHGVLLLAVGLSIVAVMDAPSRESSPAQKGGQRGGMSGVTRTALVGLAFLSVLLAHGGLSWVNNYGFHLLSQRGGSMNLLFGTNVESGGMHNLEDLELAEWTWGGANFPTAEMNRRAQDAAFERITGDIPGFVTFSFTTKMEGLYGRDPKLFRRAHGSSPRADMLEAHVKPAVERVEMGVYRLVFLLFLALLVREIWRPSGLLILGVIVLLYSAPHLLLEVDQRMHMLMLPWMVVGAVLLIHDTALKGKLPFVTFR